MIDERPHYICIGADGNPGGDMYEHLEFLRSVGTGSVLEIGVRDGVSTAAFLLSNAEHVYSVDINPACGELFKGNPKWTFIHNDSKNAASVKAQLPDKLDVLFVDGDHTYEGLTSDLRNYFMLVKEGGLILAHDVAQQVPVRPEHWGDWPGPYTSKAWNDFLAKTGLWRTATILPGKFGMGVAQLGETI